jgi:TIR domain/50S ribosome-binding GTPase
MSGAENLRVFLCHASPDKKEVSELHRRLARLNGVQPWLDVVDLIPGQEWELEIPKALEASHMIVVCLSPNSVDRDGYVQKEIKLALDLRDRKPDDRIFIVPIRLADCKLPQRLGRWHCVDLFSKGGFSEAGFDSLIRALKDCAVRLRIDISTQDNKSTDAQEHFSEKERESSAVPHEKNPVVWEQISGLAQVLPNNGLDEDLALASPSLDELRKAIKKIEEPNAVSEAPFSIVVEARFNIVVLGLAGVGKSSLINYLFEKDVREAGAGESITSLGFHRQDMSIKGFPVSLFDTAGAEIGNIDEWRKLLNSELTRRGPEQPVSKWFHTVLYCISGASGRILDYEYDLIKDFINRQYKVIIVITKADISNPKTLEVLNDLMADRFKHRVSCIEVSSVAQRLRNGQFSEQFGKPDIELEMVKGFRDVLRMRMPDRCLALLQACVDEWYQQQKKYIKKQVQKRSPEEVEDRLEDRCDEFKAELADSKLQAFVVQELQRAFAEYEGFLGNFKLSKNVSLPKLRLRAEFEGLSPRNIFDRVKAAFRTEDANAQINRSELKELLYDFVYELKQQLIDFKPALEKWVSELLEE